MKQFIFFSILFFYISLTHAANPQVLLLGEKIRIQSNQNIWIEDSSTLRAEETDQGFILIGQKKGKTRYRLGGTVIDVHVTTWDQQETFLALTEPIKKSLSLNLGWDNGEVIVNGELVRMKDWLNLYHACLKKNCDYQMRAKIKKESRDEFEKQMNASLAEAGVATQRILWGSTMAVQVPANFQNKNLLKAFGLELLETTNALEMQPVVKVDIIVAEVHKEKTLKYGIDWPNSVTAHLAPEPFDQPLQLTAQFLETNGIGKILANPTLICNSGKEATFLAGGEIPIRVGGFKNASVTWKTYGVGLKIQPIADNAGKMVLGIETEVSSLDLANSIDGVPAMATNKVQSHFNLARSQTIVLSGLIKQVEGQSQKGLPSLQHIPILGSLFSSTDFKENRTELVILVRPQIMNNQ